MSSDKIDKVLVSINADAELEQMVSNINDGFTGGRVTKTQLLSWMIKYFRQNCFRECIHEIRNAHFDDLAHLKSVIRDLEQAKKAGADIDLRALLAPVVSQPTGQTRRPKGRKTDSNSPPPAESKD